MVQWGGFEEQRNEQAEAHKGKSSFFCSAIRCNTMLMNEQSVT